MVFEYWITSNTSNDCMEKYTNMISTETDKEILHFNDIFKNKCELLYSKR